MKIAIVIILYKCNFYESPSIRSIIEYLNHKTVRNEFSILVYDNSDYEQVVLDDRFIYIPNKSNLMLAENYNKALSLCETNGVGWLVFLDQDSELSNEYMDFIFNNDLDINIAIYAPTIISKDGKRIAPYSKSMDYRNRPIRKNSRKIYSINSGSIINVDYFRKNVGLFSNEYPLDFLDHWYYHKVNKCNGAIKIILPTIIHDLSVAEHKPIDVVRYYNILISEKRFFKTELGLLDNILYRFGMIIRYIRWKRQGYVEHAKLVMEILSMKRDEL